VTSINHCWLVAASSAPHPGVFAGGMWLLSLARGSGVAGVRATCWGASAYREISEYRT